MDGVRAVALAANGRVLAGGGVDGSVRVWDLPTGTLRHSVRADRLYERLDITGLTGVTDAQRQALITLGAVDRTGGPPGPALAGSRSRARRLVEGASMNGLR
jgi:WD40 repeat protein